MGGVTLKWTTLDLCQGVSERYSKLYTNFELWKKYVFRSCEIRKHIGLKPSNYIEGKKNLKRSIHTLEDSASGVQVGDVQEVFSIIFS